VELLASLDEEALIRDVLDHRVLEDVRGLGQKPLLVDDLERLQLGQQPVELASEIGDPIEQADEKLNPARSAKRTVTCRRSPSRAERDLRIFSARCFGV